MLKCLFNKAPEEEFSILCLGAHSDDIEIGCGGTILHLIKEYKHLNITWIVFSAKQQRAAEAYASADAYLKRCEGEKSNHKRIPRQVLSVYWSPNQGFL